MKGVRAPLSQKGGRLKELTDEQLEKLKNADTSELAQIMADAVRQAGENMQNLSPIELEEDL